jgi:hypothetical protein
MFNMKRVLSFGALGALALLATTSFSTPSQARCTVNWVNGDCGPGFTAGGGQASLRARPEGSPPPVVELPHCDHEYDGEYSMKKGKKGWGKDRDTPPDAS